MHQSIHEQQRIALFEIHRHGPFQMVHPIAPGVLTRGGMGKVRFMAARNDHGRPIARPNIGEREEDVTLAAAKHVVLVAIGTRKAPR